LADYFRLSPQGLDSEEIESFPSYLARLAAVHGVSIQQFCTHLAQWWGRFGDGSKLPSDRFYQSSVVLCGVQPTLKLYVQALTQATGSSHIERTTFLALAPAVSMRTTALTRRGRTWCPTCLHDHVSSGSTVYDRLSWSLALIDRCSIHHTELVSSCAACGSPQTQWPTNGDLTQCFRCGSNLDTPPGLWKVRDRPTFGERDCIELVSSIATGELITSVDEACWIFCTEMKRLGFYPKDVVPPRYREAARIEYTDIVNLRNQRRPNFTSLLRHCSAAGVRAVDVLTSPIEAARSAGQLVPPDSPPHTSPRKREPLFHRHVSERIRQELKKPTHERITPYPVMLRELGISDGYLRYRFPNLTFQYRNRWHREFEESDRNEAIRIKIYLAAALQRYPSAEFPHQKSIVAATAKYCGCGKRRARLALNQLRKERT